MSQHHITEVQKILTDWNPLGERSTQIHDLDNYRTEAVDIIFHARNRRTLEELTSMIQTILFQAFELETNESDSRTAANKILEVIK